MRKSRLQNPITYALFTLDLLSLSMIGWGGWEQAGLPYDGLSWSFLTGRMEVISVSGPAKALLQPGDCILAIDGRDDLWASPLYADKQAGDKATYLIERQGSRQAVTTRRRSTPPPLPPPGVHW